jgi:hypothetical protein
LEVTTAIVFVRLLWLEVYQGYHNDI